jgi:abelson tyrosine-protein kinase 1
MLVVVHPQLIRSDSISIIDGTLRWQAPELMRGAQALTPEMDVYAFSICCVEILTMGALPWPLMDDDAVRHFVLSG